MLGALQKRAFRRVTSQHLVVRQTAAELCHTLGSSTFRPGSYRLSPQLHGIVLAASSGLTGPIPR